jgi:hypothetical protein
MATAADSLRVQLPGAVLLAPPHYQVIQGEEGQVLLQPPPPATAVIQITVMSAPPGADAPLPAEDLIRARAAQRGRPVQDRGDAKVITTYDESGDQEGRRVFVRFVEIGVQGRLAVIAVAVPEADLNEPANKTVMTDLPGLVQSLAAAEEGAAETAAASMSQEEPSPARGDSVRRPFGAPENEQLAECLAFADGLVGRYAAFSKDITPNLLDTVFNRWMQDADREKPDGESVALAVGAAFGEFARKKLKLSWMVVGDETGEAWALAHPAEPMMLFPIESVRKRVEEKRTNFLHDLYRTAEKQFAG